MLLNYFVTVNGAVSFNPSGKDTSQAPLSLRDGGVKHTRGAVSTPPKVLQGAPALGRPLQSTDHHSIFPLTQKFWAWPQAWASVLTKESASEPGIIHTLHFPAYPKSGFYRIHILQSPWFSGEAAWVTRSP